MRDIWHRKNIGMFDGSFSAKVSAHGTVFVKIGQPRAE